MEIIMIAAVENNYGIGKNGALLWHIPKDLKWMKEQTLNHTIVMGRKSFEDVLKYTKNKPLPQRENIIISSQYQESWPQDIIVLNSVEKTLEYLSNRDKVFILGGQKIYEAFLPYANKIILTEVKRDFEADAFFPKFSKQEFIETSRVANSEGGFEFDFVIYEKTKKNNT